VSTPRIWCIRTAVVSEAEDDDTHYAGKPGSVELVRLVFKGNATDYFRLWIVNLCFTLFTLGLFSAWAKVRRKRYFYSHTELAGIPFQYLGAPIPILKGRLIAVALVAFWWAGSQLFTPKTLLGVLCVLLLFVPWVLVRTAAFNARYSAYRNMTFHFSGSYRGAFGVLLSAAALVVVSCGFAYPWAYVRVRRYFVEHTSFGGVRASYDVRGSQLAGPFYLAFGGVAAASLLLFASARVSGHLQGALADAIFWAYALYVPAHGFLAARVARVDWRHTWLGPVGFRPTYRAGELVWLYVSNVVAIIATLGLLTPWATVRMHRYRIERLQVVRVDDLRGFVGTRQQAVAATGAEVADVFDFDLSL
jgi:uncharacterized membrane protein YjgN (DUF898 family)